MSTHWNARSPTAPSADMLRQPLDRRDAALLSLADPGADSRVVVFDPGALDLTCALIGMGVAEATIARPGCPRRAVTADIAIVPAVATAGFLLSAIGCARAMLCPLGTIVVRVRQDRTEDFRLLARRTLLLHGFASIQARSVQDDVVIKAELPLHGRLACA